MKIKIASIKFSDLEKQYFCTGGPGGQNQNRNKNGVRLIHKESGAVAESREYKSLQQNKKAALERLTKTLKFKIWTLKMAGEETPEEYAKKEINTPNHLKIELRKNEKWEEEDVNNVYIR